MLLQHKTNVTVVDSRSARQTEAVVIVAIITIVRKVFVQNCALPGQSQTRHEIPHCNFFNRKSDASMQNVYS